MLGGSTRLMGTTWSKKRPASPLYSTSSSFSSQNKRGKSYKKDRTTLPQEMFSSLYTGQQSQIKYSCNKCDHQASTQGNLKIHIQSLHEKIQYSCNQCDYQATPNGDLKTHIQSVHKKIKYSCNQCDHQATGKGNLKKHINILIWGSEDSYS